MAMVNPGLKALKTIHKYTILTENTELHRCHILYNYSFDNACSMHTMYNIVHKGHERAEHTQINWFCYFCIG